MIRDMTKGRPMGLIVSFALPLLAGMLFQQFYNVADAMIVGRFLGVNALAGVGATGSINFLVLGFCMGVCAGFSIPVAQRFGAGEMSRMREFAANGIYLSAGFALVMTAATVFFCRDILQAMNTPQDCMQESYAYISVIFAGIPFAFVYNLTSGYLRALGDSRTPLFVLVLSSVLNITLDLVFILAFDMGVAGASLATVISQAVSGMLCLLWIALRVPALHITGGEWRAKGVRLAELCACGLPMGLQYSITAIGSVILQTAVNGLGAVCVAAVTASGKVYNFLACPFEALGSTMATYAAQNVGASRYDRLTRGTLCAVGLGVAYSLAAFVFALLLGDRAVGLFVGSGEQAELIRLAHRYLSVTAAFLPLLTLVNVVRFTIQGMGFSAFAVIAGVMEMVARAATGLLLVPRLGFTGAMLGTPLAWILADLFLVPAFFRCRRMLMTRVHHRYDPA